MQNKSSNDDGVLGLVVSFGSWCSHLFSLCRSLHKRNTVIVLLQIGSSSKGHIRQMLLTPGSTAKVRMEVVLLFLWLFSLARMSAVAFPLLFSLLLLLFLLLERLVLLVVVVVVIIIAIVAIIDIIIIIQLWTIVSL